MNYCPSCGNNLRDNTKFCTKCGNSMINSLYSDFIKKTNLIPRLAIVFGIPIVALIIFGVVSITSLNNITNKQEMMLSNYLAKMDHANEIIDAINLVTINYYLVSHQITKQPQRVAATRWNIADLLYKARTAIADYERLIDTYGTNDDGARIWAEFQRARTPFINAMTLMDQCIDTRNADKLLDVILGEFSDAQQSYIEVIQNLVDLNDDLLSDLLYGGYTNQELSKNIQILIALILCLIGNVAVAIITIKQLKTAFENIDF